MTKIPTNGYYFLKLDLIATFGHNCHFCSIFATNKRPFKNSKYGLKFP
jgi:hypothetical protein